MRVLFYSIQGLSPFHFGTELEIMTRLHKEGHEVHVLVCNQVLESCFFNPCHNLLGCAVCRGRTDTFLRKIGIPSDQIHEIELPPKDGVHGTFSTLEEVLTIEEDGLKVGPGVASSAISTFRDYELTDQSDKIAYVDVLVRMAGQVLNRFRDLCEQLQPEEVYLFNGRFAEYYPLVAYCQKAGISFFTHERASSYQKYELFDNSLPHSITTRQKLIEREWQQGDPKERVEKGTAWFENRRKGILKDAINFAKELDAGTMPEGFDPSRINVAIFNSSEDEMKAIGEWRTPLYANQNDAIRQILDHFSGQDRVHFYLRMHPNLRTVDNIQTRELYHLDYPHLTLIRPREKIDTYTLLEACDKAISFGSTVGIEATFWGKPSILFGRSFYEGLDAVYCPGSFEELAELILNEDLLPFPRERALPYGFFLSTFGRTFKYLRYEDKHHAFFMGKPIRRVHIATILRLIEYLPNIPLWNRMNRLIFGRRLHFRDLFVLKSHTIEKIG